MLNNYGWVVLVERKKLRIKQANLWRLQKCSEDRAEPELDKKIFLT